MTYNAASGTFDPPTKCDWSCDAGYCKDGSMCVTSKMVACDPNNVNPANSTDITGNVTVTSVSRHDAEVR